MYGICAEGWDLGREDIVPCVTYLCSAVELILVYSAQVTVQKCCLSHETGVTTDTEQLLALGFLLILIWTRHSYHDLGQSQGHPLKGHLQFSSSATIHC